MLNEYASAVKLSLATNMPDEAKKLASRASTFAQRKQLWLLIAKELLVVQMRDIADPNGEIFKTKLREALGLLLTSQDTCLTIEDILPLLPAKTKMREIKRFLSQRVTERMSEINSLRRNIESQSKEIDKLQETKRRKGKSHILVDPNQQCDLCRQIIFSEEFYVFSCKHALHRFCIIRTLQAYEVSEAFAQKSKDRVRDLVRQVSNLYDSIEDDKS